MPIETPAARVCLGGVLVPGVVALAIDMTGYFSANRFKVAFAMGTAPLLPLSYFASLDKVPVTIDLALGAGGFVNVLVGNIDNVSINFQENTTIVSGRDLTAEMIETESANVFVNQTSSQIAGTIAANHGFSTEITATDTLVGQYYEIDHARTAFGLNSRNMTEWELLTNLAKLENYDVSMQGETLFFGVAPAQVPVVVSRQSFINAEIDISMTIPQVVAVSSWNPRNKKALSTTVGSGVGPLLVRPNLTESQASALAQNYLNDLGRHQVSFRGTMPGDLTTQPGNTIALTESASSLDQAYTVSKVTKTLGQAGFLQTIFAYAAG